MAFIIFLRFFGTLLELFWKAWHVKEKGKVLQAFFNQKILRKVFLETTIHIEIA